MKKIIFLLVTMLVLSYLGQNFSGELYNFEKVRLSQSFTLIGENIGLVLISNFLLYLFEIWRLALIGKVFQLKLTWKECFGAIALNILFAWITPAAILGAPALAFYLVKKGHPLAASISVAFIRSFSIIFVSAITTIVIFSLKLQGTMENIVLQEKIFQVLSALAIYITSLILLSYLPFKWLQKIKFINSVTTQIRLFLKEGKATLLPVLVIGVLVNFLLVSFIAYTAAPYYQNISKLVYQCMLFLSYLLLMPTPGASGLAEIGAPMFFGKEVPLQELITIVTSMRISTIGFQVIVGMIAMFIIFRRNISLSELKSFKKSKIQTLEDDLHGK